MKNIAILTFHRAQNYGSALQAYALNKYINNIPNTCCEVLDFIPSGQEEMYSIFRKVKKPKDILRNIVMLSHYSFVNNRKNSFSQFVKDKLQTSERTYINENDFKYADEHYSKIVCGSDQIWNVGIADYDLMYFLTAIKKADKVSYAPSIGNGDFNSIAAEELNKIKNSLMEFKALSVRESKGREVLEELLDNKRKFTVTLDPTLLLNREYYDAICSPRRVKEDYIFFYSIDYNLQVVEMVKKISKQTNLPVVVMYTRGQTFTMLKNGFQLPKYNSPEDFLSMVKNATLVLSNSFHGTAFSVIYNKAFYALAQTDENGNVHRDARINTLLKAIGLENRLISEKNFDDTKTGSTIDFKKANTLLEEERQLSKAFLENAILED